MQQHVHPDADGAVEIDKARIDELHGRRIDLHLVAGRCAVDDLQRTGGAGLGGWALVHLFS